MIDQNRMYCHLHFKAICGPKANNCRKCLIFFGNSIVHRRRMVKSTYVIKNRFIEKILFWEIIVDT